MYKLLLFLAIPLQLFSQNNFLITGKVEGVSDAATVTLQHFFEKNTIATTHLKQGQFTLTGSLPSADLYTLTLNGKPLRLFIYNDTMSIVGKFDDWQNAQVQGSALQNDFLAYVQTFNSIGSEVDRLNQTLATVADDDEKMDVVDNYKMKLQTRWNNFATTRLKSPVSTFALQSIYPLLQNPTQLYMNYNHLDTAAKQGFSNTAIINTLQKSNIGMPAKNFIQSDINGKSIVLSEFHGKYVLVDFWASWCGPCRMENPNVVAAYKKYKNRNFTVLGVSLDNDKSRWEAAIAADSLLWTQVSDLKGWYNEAAQAYQITSIPSNILIDTAGNIIGANLRGLALDQTLEAILPTFN